MNLNFWDGVMISSMFWLIISLVCLIRGLWVGIMNDSTGWAEGFDEGWWAAAKVYVPEVWEMKQEGDR